MGRWGRNRHRAPFRPYYRPAPSPVTEVSVSSGALGTIEEGVYVERYATWGEFVDRAEREAADLAGSHVASRHSPREFGWDLSAGFAGALKLAREGWGDGESKVKQLSQVLFDRVSNQIEREFIQYDVEGSEIDVARYLDGEPECWQRFETRVTEGAGRRIVTIAYNCAASAGVSADVLLAKGAAVVALVELLEFAGHGVRVIICDGQQGSMLTETYVTVKEPDQPIDVSRIAFAVAHPATMRRLMFSVWEQFPPAVREAINVPHGGYGMPCDVRKAHRGDIYMEHSMYGGHQWLNTDAARAWVTERLKEQGVVLAEEVA